MCVYIYIYIGDGGVPRALARERSGGAAAGAISQLPYFALSANSVK